MGTDNVFQNRGLDDPSVRPMVFFDELASNTTKHNISVVLYSGNADSLVPHWSTEGLLQLSSIKCS
jgi:carboxypeptidase D